ncbi:sensor histidine kinase [Brevibacillus daliensis]|uniref:sensor histidine kinase n=1 Tax=Brevibacillus daliensis TaxID=2892995 RepID=UPI001E5DA031|nr:sensor histidine kinase [Brevibacillus daliensis]
MRLFLREHLKLFIFQFCQLFFLFLILVFDGYDNYSVLMYFFILSTGLLAVYLIMSFIRSKEMYQHLEQQRETLEDYLGKWGDSPLSEAYFESTQEQYRLYQRMIIERERKKEEQVTFMNQWVHQMKTPLSVIQLLVQDEDEQPFPSIREEAERIGRGLDMVLHSSRLEVFERDFRVDSIELRSLVQKVVQEHKTFFIRSKVFPDVQIEEGVRVETDAKWLAFMLSQLISNAIKYSAGQNQKITLSLRKRETDLILDVIDRGIGIVESDKKRVFRPFFTGENGRKYRESTGMGLYLVEQISEKLGHKVELESKVNEGTTVSIVFPEANRT